MLRTVEEVAIQLRVSKTSIYNKLKLKQYKSKIIKKQGKSMVDDDLFNLIKDSLKLKSKVENQTKENDYNEEISIDSDDLLNLNSKLNIDLVNSLVDQLKEKDKQISELHKLIENNQILLKQQQDKEIKQLNLEEHFQEVDQKLGDLREKMEQKKKAKKGLFNFLK